MQLKVLSKRGLWIIIPLGIILLTPLLLNFIPKTSTSTSTSNSSKLVLKKIATFPNQEQTSRNRTDIISNQEQTSFGRLNIPIINVDAAVISVGLTPNGAMDAPKGPAEVAWFNLGPYPGENGSAVIAGHYGWKNNMPAVFDNLNKLNKDDKIIFKDEKGIDSTFVVREIKKYGKDDIAPDVFSSSDGKAHLNLITCTGTWNKEEKIFSERLIIFTDLE